MSIPTRKIADTSVPMVGFGAMGLSAYYGSIEPDEERFKVLDSALEQGCTFWDTADVYGDNEELIGKWFKRTGKRDEIFLATKFGITPSGPNGSPEYVRSAFNKSLSRLGVDRVDLYYLHRPDSNVPIEKTVGAMAEFVKEGKIKYIGLSEITANTLRRAHKVHPIAAVQVEYSPFSLDIEDLGLVKACRELSVAIVAYSPLGRGFLTGRYKSPDDLEEGDWRRDVPKYQKDNFPNILKLVEGLEEIGKRHGATAGQVSMAWVMAQGEDIIPIPGTKKIKYLKENIDSYKLKLTPEELQEVRQIAEKANAHQFERYKPSDMARIMKETPEL